MKKEYLPSHTIYYKKMNWEKSCCSSFCEPAATERRSKKAHGLPIEKPTSNRGAACGHIIIGIMLADYLRSINVRGWRFMSFFPQLRLMLPRARSRLRSTLGRLVSASEA